MSDLSGTAPTRDATTGRTSPVGGITVIAVPWDHPEAVALRTTQQVELRERYGQPPPDGEPPAEQMLVTVLAVLDGVAVGCGSLRDAGHLGLDGQVGELKRMFVDPAYRGRGLARHLLATLEHCARERGIERLVLETGVRQPEAIALYQSAGYRCIPSYGVYAGDIDSVCYARWLDDARTTSEP